MLLEVKTTRRSRTISKNSCARRKRSASANSRVGASQRRLEHCAECHSVWLRVAMAASDLAISGRRRGCRRWGQIPSSAEGYACMTGVVYPGPKNAPQPWEIWRASRRQEHQERYFCRKAPFIINKNSASSNLVEREAQIHHSKYGPQTQAP